MDGLEKKQQWTRCFYDTPWYVFKAANQECNNERWDLQPRLQATVLSTSSVYEQNLKWRWKKTMNSIIYQTGCTIIYILDSFKWNMTISIIAKPNKMLRLIISDSKRLIFSNPGLNRDHRDT